MASESESKPSEVKLTITNEKVNTSDVTQGIAVDLNERDPNNLHEDLKVIRCCVLIAFGVCSVEVDVSETMYCFQRLGININATNIDMYVSTKSVHLDCFLLHARIICQIC